MKPDIDMLRGAMLKGRARIRHLAGGALFINLPDRDTTIIALNVGNMFNTSKCKRLSRGCARRLVSRMTDASPALKALYIEMVNAGREGEGVNA